MLCLLLAVDVPAFSQTKADTLHLQKLQEACRKIDRNKDFTSLLPVALEFEKACLDRKNEYYLGWASWYMALACDNSAQYKRGIDYANQAIRIAHKYRNRSLEGLSYSAKGNLYERTGKIKEAMEAYYKELACYDKMKDSSGIAGAYSNIGIIYQYLPDYKKSAEYLEKALKIYEATGSLEGQSNALNNIAVSYYFREDFAKALHYYERAMELFKKTDNPYGISAALMNIAGVYTETGDYEKGLKYMQEALALKRKIGQTDGAIRALANVGEIYDYMKQYDKALECNLEALKEAQKINAPDLICSGAKNLSIIYETTGDHKNALKYFKMYTQYQDSLYNRENASKLAEQETQYVYEKKMYADSVSRAEKEQVEKLQREKEKVLQEEKEKRSLMYMLLLAAGVIFALVLAFSFYKRNKEKQRANEMIAAQKNEVQRQKDIIEEKHQEITDSINYAQRIQQAILKSENAWKSLFRSSFIFFRPRDIVSGDFYWSTRVEIEDGQGVKNYHVWCVADCTGHGVPGALMSMLGISFLNELVNEKKEIDPAQILNKLREKIMTSLESSVDQVEQKDGMDISLCVLDTAASQLTYAGANNPLWVARKNNQHESGIEWIEFRPDKMPVGSYRVMNTFTNQTVQVRAGDRIFNFSDGYADQFGGEKGKKMNYARFREILISTSNLSLEEQGRKVRQEYDLWKRDYQQLDDVCVTGIEI